MVCIVLIIASTLNVGQNHLIHAHVCTLNYHVHVVENLGEGLLDFEDYFVGN